MTGCYFSVKYQGIQELLSLCLHLFLVLYWEFICIYYNIVGGHCGQISGELTSEVEVTTEDQSDKGESEHEWEGKKGERMDVEVEVEEEEEEEEEEGWQKEEVEEKVEKLKDEGGDVERDLNMDSKDGNERKSTNEAELPSIRPCCDPVSESRDVLCPICLQVLWNPVQVNCCGKRFCYVCIDHVMAMKMHCPHCAVGSYSYFYDIAAKQEICGLEIYCTNKKHGCKWKGELCNLQKHLNANPAVKSETIGCHFVPVPCVHCGGLFHRSHMFVCPFRPYTCRSCYAYKSTFEDVETNHMKECKFFERECDYCGKLVTQGYLKIHTQFECIKNYDVLHSK